MGLKSALREAYRRLQPTSHPATLEEFAERAESPIELREETSVYFPTVSNRIAITTIPAYYVRISLKGQDRNGRRMSYSIGAVPHTTDEIRRKLAPGGYETLAQRAAENIAYLRDARPDLEIRTRQEDPDFLPRLLDLIRAP